MSEPTRVSEVSSPAGPAGGEGVQVRMRRLGRASAFTLLLITLALAAVWTVYSLAAGFLLYQALQEDDLAKARRLIQWGADVNSQLCTGSTALMTAIYDCSDAVPLLLRHPLIRLNERNPQGETALTIALAFRRLDAAEAILAEEQRRCQEPREPGARLQHAALRGDVRAASALLARGVSPEATEPDGPTPLIGACLMGRRPMVQLLLQHGARVDTVYLENTSEETLALQAAFDSQDAEIVRQVLRAGGTRFNAKAIESGVVRCWTLEQLRQLRACTEASRVSPKALRLAYDKWRDAPEGRELIARWLRWARRRQSPRGTPGGSR